MSFPQLLLIWAEGIEFILFPKLQLHMFGETDAKKTSTNNIVGSVQSQEGDVDQSTEICVAYLKDYCFDDKIDKKEVFNP